ncbi:MAG: tRNA (N6-isopentenyl adenosine(37)-C2)-methylthiotransferase MiaB [Candidatus Omnitrophica bacterium]|nr:tRNA (N6-isopentenyl adenosine(37)-C2)-methylthiotransferase MiaB [Candidatus Omnitrophota bacterium]
MNAHDSEKIAGLLLSRDYEMAPRAEDADVILVNTCSVRKHAEDRVIGHMNHMKSLKLARPNLILGLVGCMAENHKEKLFEALPHIDIVCGTNNIYELPELLKAAADKGNNGNGKIVAAGRISRPVERDFPVVRKKGINAWVSIMEGCDNFCSYCIVPYVRGREVSRPYEQILKEIGLLIQQGFRDITLLGQNVNSYGRNLNPSIDFVTLLKRIDSLAGEKWIRFVTSHPKDATAALFETMANISSVCEHLHLPLQSGSDRILELMNRRYTLSDYIKKVEGLRRLIPDVSLTTDVIVGFPGETDEDFQFTYKAMGKIGFDSAYIFKYSPRPYSKAVELKDDVPKKVKEERNYALLELQENIAVRKNKELIGKTIPVLVEGLSSKARQAAKCGTSQLCGRTRINKIAVFDGASDLKGKFVEVEICDATANTLIGRKV